MELGGARIDRSRLRRRVTHREQEPDVLRGDLRERAERRERGAHAERSGER